MPGPASECWLDAIVVPFSLCLSVSSLSLLMSVSLIGNCLSLFPSFSPQSLHLSFVSLLYLCLCSLSISLSLCVTFLLPVSLCSVSFFLVSVSPSVSLPLYLCQCQAVPPLQISPQCVKLWPSQTVPFPEEFHSTNGLCLHVEDRG